LSKVTKRTKAIIINSPHNPTGAIFSADSLKTLAAKLNEQRVMVIADDIYVKLTYTDNFLPVPSAGFTNLVIVNGFSKSQALTGWRIGYATADKQLIQAMINLQSHLLGNAALPSQEAALAALTKHDQPPASTISALKRQRQMVMDSLDALAGIDYHCPEGAFYIFIDLRRLTKLPSSEWCERLLNQTGVALVPGEAFSAPGFARLSFVAGGSALEPALKALSEFVCREKKS
jgi:aspartate aminotransferase